MIEGDSTEPTLTVVGAGPSGLAAAITAARAGLRVTVHERRRDVGARFHGDFQAIENWTTDRDVLDELSELGIEPAFDHLPVTEQLCFGPDGRLRRFRSSRPFYYLVRRGPVPGSLDSSLRSQAIAAGADLRLGQACKERPPARLVASGPRRAFAAAKGYLFATGLDDGSYVLLDDRIAPGGYGYLLVWGGLATLAVCVFDRFPQLPRFLDATVEFFERRLGFTLPEATQFSGVGDVFPPSWSPSPEDLVGEAGGIQDALWGFGIRYALLSGWIAGRRAAGSSDPRLAELWRDRIERPVKASFVNRLLVAAGGNLGFRFLLWSLARSPDPRRYLGRLYRPRRWKLLAAPLATAIARWDRPGRRRLSATG